MGDGRRQHLRIISSANYTQESGGPKDREPEQLAFTYTDPDVVVLINVDGMDSNRFLSTVERVKPSVIIEARPVPRLDLLAGSRKRAFEMFERCESCYIDLFGRLKINSHQTAAANPAFWATELVELLRKKRSGGGPYLFIFDDAALVTAAERIVPDVLKLAADQRMQISRLP